MTGGASETTCLSEVHTHTHERHGTSLVRGRACSLNCSRRKAVGCKEAGRLAHGATDGLSGGFQPAGKCWTHACGTVESSTAVEFFFLPSPAGLGLAGASQWPSGDRPVIATNHHFLPFDAHDALSRADVFHGTRSHWTEGTPTPVSDEGRSMVSARRREYPLADGDLRRAQSQHHSRARILCRSIAPFHGRSSVPGVGGSVVPRDFETGTARSLAPRRRCNESCNKRLSVCGVD